VAYLKVISCHSLTETDENHENTTKRAGNSAEIRKEFSRI
jgi:hypothetical protein